VQTTKLIFLAVPILLSGCVTAPLVLTGISVGSVAVSETTGKSLTDHTVSTVAGQDCKVSRMFQDRAVCQDKNTTKLQVTTTGVAPSTIADIESRYRQ
jgi:starvation-inducible outer membrane lipoprotein